MGAKLSCLWRLFTGRKTKFSQKTKEFMKPKCFKMENRRRISQRKIEIETSERKNLKDYLMSGSDDELCVSKQSMKKVHPCSTTRFRGSLIRKAKDSLCLDRFVNLHEERGEGMSNCSFITQKRVSFKLPHTVIFYSPDEPYCKEASLEDENKPYSNEDSFSSPNCKDISFESVVEEPFFRLAVDILPHVFVSSKV